MTDGRSRIGVLPRALRMLQTSVMWSISSTTTDWIRSAISPFLSASSEYSAYRYGGMGGGSSIKACPSAVFTSSRPPARRLAMISGLMSSMGIPLNVPQGSPFYDTADPWAAGGLRQGDHEIWA